MQKITLNFEFKNLDEMQDFMARLDSDSPNTVQPTQPAAQSESLLEAAPTPQPSVTPPQASSGDVDKDGLPWDERIHATTRAKNADGTWRKRRGIDDTLISTVEAELRNKQAPTAEPIATGDTPAQPMAQPTMQAQPPMQAPVQQPAPQPLPMPTGDAPVQQPIAQPAPAPQPLPMPSGDQTVQATAQLSGQEFMGKIATLIQMDNANGGKMLTTDDLAEMYATLTAQTGYVIQFPQDIITDPNRINLAVAYLTEKGKWV